MNGIVTKYKGYKFRSRLEAKWAAFFDLLNWKWEYEPCDFNGWIPDFALFGKKIIYVEVKPISQFSKKVAEKIDSAKCHNECLIVGLRPFENDVRDGQVLLGWLRETSWDCDKEQPDEFWWTNAVFGQWEHSCNIGFCHAEGTFDDRISGCYDGGCFGGVILEKEAVFSLWSKACNRVQWKRKQDDYEPLSKEEFNRRREQSIRALKQYMTPWKRLKYLLCYKPKAMLTRRRLARMLKNDRQIST